MAKIAIKKPNQEVEIINYAKGYNDLKEFFNDFTDFVWCSSNGDFGMLVDDRCNLKDELEYNFRFESKFGIEQIKGIAVWSRTDGDSYRLIDLTDDDIAYIKKMIF